MKPTVWRLLVLALSLGGAAPRAAQLDELYLEQCKQQLSQRYGAGHEIKLVSMRRSGSGASVKVAVRLDDGKVGKERVEFASCQISRKELPEN
ncbi:MAG: hypothetical protein KA135_10915 [Halioglobus sp.]|jgi:hypothetical protein|nr:hypothetical protein [Halioglobus sp.]